MIVSVILVYLLMVALYNSYVSPFIIIFSFQSRLSERSARSS